MGGKWEREMEREMGGEQLNVFETRTQQSRAVTWHICSHTTAHLSLNGSPHIFC